MSSLAPPGRWAVGWGDAPFEAESSPREIDLPPTPGTFGQEYLNCDTPRCGTGTTHNGNNCLQEAVNSFSNLDLFLQSGNGPNGIDAFQSDLSSTVFNGGNNIQSQWNSLLAPSTGFDHGMVPNNCIPPQLPMLNRDWNANITHFRQSTAPVGEYSTYDQLWSDGALTELPIGIGLNLNHNVADDANYGYSAQSMDPYQQPQPNIRGSAPQTILPTPQNRRGARGSVKTYACEVCSTSLRRAGDYRRHMMKHQLPSEYPFPCDFPGCSMRFYRKDKLDTHSRVHLNVY